MSVAGCEFELGDNVALEYTRDSPMFRQQLKMFEEAHMQVVPFATRSASSRHLHLLQTV